MALYPELCEYDHIVIRDTKRSIQRNQIFVTYIHCGPVLIMLDKAAIGSTQRVQQWNTGLIPLIRSVSSTRLEI